MNALLTASHIAVIAGIVFGIPMLVWLVIWLIYRNRWICPACCQRTVRFALGFRPTSTAYFVCGSCGAHLKAQGNFSGLFFDSCGIPFRKRGCHFITASEQEWKKLFG